MLLNIFYVAVAIFALGFCIFIHELGHYLAAVKRGLVAERFSVGFGPRLIGWKWNGTDFRLSLIPFGGYVSLPQLVDMGKLEGGETPEDAAKLPPISYADKMIVSVMGAVFNMIFAVVLSLVLWGVGREIVKSTEVGFISEEIVTSDRELARGPALAAGMQVGDTIVSVDGQRVGSWMQFQNALMTGTGRAEDGRAMAEIGIVREGEAMTLTVYPETYSSERIRHIGVWPTADVNAAPIIIYLEDNMPAKAAGLKKDDRILKLDGEKVVSGGFLSAYLANNGDREIEITIERNGRELVVPVKPKIKDDETSPRFGFAYDYPFKTERVHYNPIEQIGIFANTLRMTLLALVHTESDVKVKNMSGPVGIVHGLSRFTQNGFIELLWFLALINVNLAIFNLLPIPVLDGGHMLFATISKVIRRPLPISVMEKIQVAFMVLLLGTALYITFFDIGRVGRDIGLLEDESLTVKEENEEAASP
ncbi:MAG: site-2 protease family protein [Opitutales bacterium]